MCMKKGLGKGAGTSLPFRSGDMNYVQGVDIIFLNLVRTVAQHWRYMIEHPYGASQCPPPKGYHLVLSKVQ